MLTDNAYHAVVTICMSRCLPQMAKQSYIAEVENQEGLQALDNSCSPAQSICNYQFRLREGFAYELEGKLL